MTLVAGSTAGKNGSGGATQGDGEEATEARGRGVKAAGGGASAERTAQCRA